MSATESRKMWFCFGLCIIFNLFLPKYKQEKWSFSCFCQKFLRFFFLTLFCFLVAHIIFNQRSFCRMYPQKKVEFSFFPTMWLSHQYLPRIIFRTILYRLQNILDQYDRTAFSLSQSIVAYQQQYNFCATTEKKFFRNIHQMERKTTMSQIDRTSSALPRSKTKQRLHTKQNMRIKDSRWCTYLARRSIVWYICPSHTHKVQKKCWLWILSPVCMTNLANGAQQIA